MEDSIIAYKLSVIKDDYFKFMVIIMGSAKLTDELNYEFVALNSL